MLTYFCPNCWVELSFDQQICPQCGYVLDAFDSLTYEDKLLAALKHILPDRRIMAAQILGNLHSVRALKEFESIVAGGEENYYLLRAVLLAAAKIDHPDRQRILQKATHHSSALVAALAVRLLETLAQGKSISEWDENTG